jgi:hypothetical protein
MTGSGIAIAALVVVGIVLVLMGLFAGGGEVPIIGLGVLSLVAGGVLSVWARRSTTG